LGLLPKPGFKAFPSISVERTGILHHSVIPAAHLGGNPAAWVVSSGWIDKEKTPDSRPDTLRE